MVASFTRRASTGTWPIDPDAVATPEGWRGWPEGRDFALVLLHDVDTIRGADKCINLMDIERRMGFRSSFNFVPERYALEPSIRQRIVSSGFEVGVHGLKHDGRLFTHRRIFDERAPRINAYLNAWNSVGFTAPSMLRNLDWIAELDIEYSCSTFDTDPFEPQNDAAKTIFPLVVHDGSNQRLHIEMPYTLPQDHCLFIILGEQDIGIWIKKLRWIAENGGVAMLISHPDYMSFDESGCSFEEYPAKYYMDFLSHVRQEYGRSFWHPLPRELARFWKRRTERTLMSSVRTANS